MADVSLQDREEKSRFTCGTGLNVGERPGEIVVVLCATTSQSCVDIESRCSGGAPHFTAQCGVAQWTA
jgi:hypothetical protein